MLRTRHRLPTRHQHRLHSRSPSKTHLNHHPHTSHRHTTTRPRQAGHNRNLHHRSQALDPTTRPGPWRRGRAWKGVVKRHVSIGRRGVCCNSFLTIRSIGVGVRPGGIATFVNPSNYNGSAILHALSHVRRVVPNTRIRNRILLRNGGLCSGSISPITIHHSINVIFRHPGPFPAVSVHRGILTNIHLGGRRLTGSSTSSLIR